MEGWKLDILNVLLGLAVPALLWVISKGVEYSKSKVKSETAKKAVVGVEFLLKMLIEKVGGPFVADLKAKSADGKLTYDEAKLARSMVVETAKKNLVGDLKEHIKSLDLDNLDEYLESKIEELLKRSKDEKNKPE